MCRPLVTIILSFFNAEKTLPTAIRSILLQTCQDWEMILINDGSTDGSSEIAGSFLDPRIRILGGEERMGLAQRLNQGVCEAKGEYIARMDADDVAYPSRLEVQAEFIGKNIHTDVVASRVVIFESNGEVTGTYPFRQEHEEICRRPCAGFYFPHPTWLGKAAWFRANPYSPAMIKAQDQELLLRTFEKSRFACVPQILLGYRKANLSISTAVTGRFLYSKALIRKAFRDRKPFFLFGVPEQALKFMVESFAMASGLNYHVLRHRALPVSKEECEEWEKVWSECNRPGGGKQCG